jgi:hypothetical protein
VRSAGDRGIGNIGAANVGRPDDHGPRDLQPPGAVPLSGNRAGVGDLRPAARPHPGAARPSPASPAQGRQPKLLERLCEAIAPHALEENHDIRAIQELLGHKDVKTTMIYTHVLLCGA